MNQPTLFETGTDLRDQGIERAVSHAERIDPGWKEKVWDLFKRWIAKKEVGYKFLIEDFRRDVEKFGKIESPPSNRAFGFVSVRAAKQNLIIQVGTQKVKNKKAHRANSACWQKL